MSVPLVNARLTAIAGGGLTEDYDQPAGADGSRWSGAADAYLDERLLENVGADGLDQVAATRLVVPLEPGELVKRGDSVTYTYADGAQTRTVQNIQQFRLFGTVVLWMWEV